MMKMMAWLIYSYASDLALLLLDSLSLYLCLSARFLLRLFGDPIEVSFSVTRVIFLPGAVTLKNRLGKVELI